MPLIGWLAASLGAMIVGCVVVVFLDNLKVRPHK